MQRIKQLNKTLKGQALLVVIVVSTLALLILLTMADRILLSRVNVQRSEEFDRSVSIAENQVNEIIKILDSNATVSSNCLQPVNSSAVRTNYVPLTCTELNAQGAKVYARISNNSFIDVSPLTPMTHQVGTSPVAGQNTTGIVAVCDNFNTSSPPRFIITRVYLENGVYYTDKAIFTCTTNAGTNNARGNVDLFSARTNTQVAGQAIAAPTTRNTILIRIKPYDDSQATAQIRIATYNAASTQISGTGKYEFLVTGLGDLGSDSGISFERPILGNSSFAPSFFDYVYYGEDQ